MEFSELADEVKKLRLKNYCLLFSEQTLADLLTDEYLC